MAAKMSGAKTVRGRTGMERASSVRDLLVADLLGALGRGLTMPVAARLCAVSLRTAHRRLAEARVVLGVGSTSALVAGSTVTGEVVAGDFVDVAGTPTGSLTDRQREVLGLVAVGATTPAIALELGIAAATVESHLRSARLKLGAETRWQAIAATSPAPPPPPR